MKLVGKIRCLFSDHLWALFKCPRNDGTFYRFWYCGRCGKKKECTNIVDFPRIAPMTTRRTFLGALAAAIAGIVRFAKAAPKPLVLVKDFCTMPTWLVSEHIDRLSQRADGHIYRVVGFRSTAVGDDARIRADGMLESSHWRTMMYLEPHNLPPVYDFAGKPMFPHTKPVSTFIREGWNPV